MCDRQVSMCDRQVSMCDRQVSMCDRQVSMCDGQVSMCDRQVSMCDEFNLNIGFTLHITEQLSYMTLSNKKQKFFHKLSLKCCSIYLS